MLQTPKEFKYSTMSDSASLLYKISTNDILNFRIYSNDGFKLINLSTITNGEGGSSAQGMGEQPYLVEFDGTVKLPVLGRTLLKGMTLRESELFLEQKYSEYYNKPFVLLKITNRRVTVFPGEPGQAKVIPLLYENTTLMEALAIAGGISRNGKAKKIKLIRGNLSNPEVYLIDLSTIDGMKQSDMVLQANDIIYVEPRKNVPTEILREISPFLSVLTTLYLIIRLTTLVKQ